ncbi:RNA-binding S4 domain [Moorella glycerini]|uniref:Ribosome-associated protein n=2 Tax=Neomoorella stamsii TaxID=1266720 RepID=A0A9X7P6D2_9FIRM|nr:ribosome-associated protein [Moorella stamsii]CEP67738.1 RNA-binding S4 domain [Moorella glycerini]
MPHPASKDQYRTGKQPAKCLTGVIMPSKNVPITTPSIRLDQFLKWAGIAATGGQAKEMIAGGLVRVNGQTEKRRSHTLGPGDEVEVKGASYKLTAAPVD